MVAIKTGQIHILFIAPQTNVTINIFADIYYVNNINVIPVVK